MNPTSIADIRECVRSIYKTENFLKQFMLIGRPYICPFHILVECVPTGSVILDIGCGSGTFINLLSHRKQIAKGIGFDASLKPIEIARKGLAESRAGAEVKFHHISVESEWPNGLFDVVSMIDVMHHINPKEQRNAIEQAVRKVAPGGLFLYKDIGSRPHWRAWANRLHDLILARQWINYVASQDVIKWTEHAGLILERKETINMLWYGHELIVFRRDTCADTRAI